MLFYFFLTVALKLCHLLPTNSAEEPFLDARRPRRSTQHPAGGRLDLTAMDPATEVFRPAEITARTALRHERGVWAAPDHRKRLHTEPAACAGTQSDKSVG